MNPVPATKDLPVDDRIGFSLQVNDAAILAEELQAALERFVEGTGRPELRGALFAIIQELAGNALKAVYKRLYYQHVIDELGLGQIEYREWLRIFRAEIESNRSDNFARLCRDKNIFVEISGRPTADGFLVEVENDGALTPIEQERISAALERARELENIGALFDDDDEEDTDKEDLHEGGGLGLPLIVATLRGLGVDTTSLRIVSEDSRTAASFLLPYSLLRRRNRSAVTLLPNNRRMLSIVWNTFRRLNQGVLRFTADGDLFEASLAVLQPLGLGAEDIGELPDLLPGRFFSDIFQQGPRSIRVIKQFANYRVWIPNRARDLEVLFDVSGYLSDNDVVNTVWQVVLVQQMHENADEGSIVENLQVQEMIRPYISPQVVIKARETVRQGKKQLPDEVRDITLFFCDIVGFTRIAEQHRPHEVVTLLNLALGVAVRAIRKYDGQIDKFMGDAVMALFRNPHHAVAAAMEIQIQFAQMNDFRREIGEESLAFRVGIHSGKVILGNIGSGDRLDWTAIGDTVNTAARIEKSSEPGRVLISEDTFRRIEGTVEVGERLMLRVKGKREEIAAYFVKSVQYMNGDMLVSLRHPRGI